MRTDRFIFGVGCILVGLLLYIFDITQYIQIFESTKVSIYPAAAFGLLGIWQIYLSLKPLFKR